MAASRMRRLGAGLLGTLGILLILASLLLGYMTRSLFNEQAFASRVAASLDHCVGLDALVVATVAEYEELAVALAEDRARLAALREALAAALPTTPLFDAARFARELEHLYARMHARRIAGLGPADLAPEPAA